MTPEIYSYDLCEPGYHHSIACQLHLYVLTSRTLSGENLKKASTVRSEQATILSLEPWRCRRTSSQVILPWSRTVYVELNYFVVVYSILVGAYTVDDVSILCPHVHIDFRPPKISEDDWYRTTEHPVPHDRLSTRGCMSSMCIVGDERVVYFRCTWSLGKIYARVVSNSIPVDTCKPCESEYSSAAR